MHVTDAYLRAWKPPKTSAIEVSDTTRGRVGLVWRQNRRGEITALIRPRTSDGRRPRLHCGSWPAETIQQIAARARLLKSQIDHGVNPRDEGKAKAATAVADAATVADRLDQWQAARAAAWSPRTALEIHRVCAHDILPTFGKRRLTDLTRADWTGLILAKRTVAPGRAGFLYDIVSSFTGFCEATGWLEYAPLPRKGRSLLAPKVPPRQRALTDDELVAVWRAATEFPANKRVFVRLLALTGGRVSEVSGICAGEVDLAAGTWTLPPARAKNKRSVTLPLGAIAARELRLIWPDDVQPQTRLLGLGAGSHSDLKARLDILSGVTDWRLHDLRRTMRTGLARLGVTREVAELALNHVSGFTPLERIYNTHPYREEVLAAVLKWQQHIAQLVEPERLRAV